MEFKELKTTKKGDIGENIVKQMLEQKGFVVYQPQTDAPHPYDIMAVKDKVDFTLYEVKTKARLNYIPATGINQANYKYYAKVCEKHNLRLFLVFVDEHPSEQRIYGNYLDVLEEPYTEKGIQYPLIKEIKGGVVRLYPISKMQHIADLSKEDIKRVKQYNTRNYSYKGV